MQTNETISDLGCRISVMYVRNPTSEIENRTPQYFTLKTLLQTLFMKFKVNFIYKNLIMKYLWFYMTLLWLSCNDANPSKNTQKAIVTVECCDVKKCEKYSNALQEFSKSYVVTIESTEPRFRKNLYTFYKITEQQYLADSTIFHQNTSKIESFDVDYIDFLLCSSTLDSLKMTMIYTINPFQSNRPNWYKPDDENRGLVQKVLIDDYFMGRKTDYNKRQSDISNIDKSFNLSAFKEWYSNNKNLDIKSLKERFKVDFPVLKSH